jgi:hypothetical protein
VLEVGRKDGVLEGMVVEDAESVALLVPADHVCELAALQQTPGLLHEGRNRFLQHRTKLYIIIFAYSPL